MHNFWIVVQIEVDGGAMTFITASESFEEASERVHEQIRNADDAGAYLYVAIPAFGTAG